jgi:hypothetical protein
MTEEAHEARAKRQETQEHKAQALSDASGAPRGDWVSQLKQNAQSTIWWKMSTRCC